MPCDGQRDRVRVQPVPALGNPGRDEGRQDAKQKKPAKEKEAKAAPASAPAEMSVPGVAEYADFQKLELRVGTILEAGRVPKADKLLCFKIDLGEAEPRQILSGIAEHFEPETLVGRQVCVVANLAPRKIRGLVSAGMILTAETPGRQADPPRPRWGCRAGKQDFVGEKNRCHWGNLSEGRFPFWF